MSDLNNINNKVDIKTTIEEYKNSNYNNLEVEQKNIDLEGIFDSYTKLSEKEQKSTTFSAYLSEQLKDKASFKEADIDFINKVIDVNQDGTLSQAELDLINEAYAKDGSINIKSIVNAQENTVEAIENYYQKGTDEYLALAYLDKSLNKCSTEELTRAYAISMISSVDAQNKLMECIENSDDFDAKYEELSGVEYDYDKISNYRKQSELMAEIKDLIDKYKSMENMSLEEYVQDYVENFDGDEKEAKKALSKELTSALHDTSSNVNATNVEIVEGNLKIYYSNSPSKEVSLQEFNEIFINDKLDECYGTAKKELGKGDARSGTQKILNNCLGEGEMEVSWNIHWINKKSDSFKYTDEDGNVTKKDYLSDILQAADITPEVYLKAANSYYQEKAFGSLETVSNETTAEDTKSSGVSQESYPANTEDSTKEADSAEENNDTKAAENKSSGVSQENQYVVRRDEIRSGKETQSTQEANENSKSAEDSTNNTNGGVNTASSSSAADSSQEVNKETSTNLQVLASKCEDHFAPPSVDDKTGIIDTLIFEENQGKSITVEQLMSNLGYNNVNEGGYNKSLEAEAIAKIIDSNGDGSIAVWEWGAAKEILSNEDGVFSALSIGQKAREYKDKGGYDALAKELKTRSQELKNSFETKGTQQTSESAEVQSDEVQSGNNQKSTITAQNSKVQDKLKTDDNGNTYIEVEPWDDNSESLNCLSRIISNVYGVSYNSSEGQEILQKLIEANSETIDPNNLDGISTGAKIVLPDVEVDKNSESKETNTSQETSNTSKTETTNSTETSSAKETETTQKENSETSDDEDAVTAENADAIIGEIEPLEMGQSTDYNKNCRRNESLHKWYRQALALDIKYEETESDNYRVRKENGKKIVELGCKNENGEFVATIRYDVSANEMKYRYDPEKEFEEITNNYKKKPE